MDAAIIRAGGVDLTQIAEACGEAGINEAIVIGSSIGDHLIDRPRPAVIIGVLQSSEGQSPEGAPAGSPGLAGVSAFTNYDVLLRVGMALERGVPTCLIAPPPLQVPTGLPSLMIVPCPVDDLESLRLHLWAVTNAVSVDSQHVTAPVSTRKQINANYFLRSLESIFRDGNPGVRAQRTEQLTAQLLREAGLGFAESPERGGPDEGFDIAVLPDQLSDEMTFIQVKSGHLDERRLHDAELRLQETVINRRCQLGVLIYHDAEGRRLPAATTTPLIVRIALEDLILRLGRENFRRVLDDEVASAVERI
jgi:hypothetical protein